MTAHLDFFALSIEPFSKEIDDKDLWLPPSKKGLVDELVDARGGTRERRPHPASRASARRACFEHFDTRCPPTDSG